MAFAATVLLPWSSMAAAAVKEPSMLPALTSRLVTQRPLIAVAMAGTRIVAVGRMGHVVYSDDEGRHWLQAKVPVSVDLVSVRFLSDKQGWATGHDGILLRSDDGGVSWQLVLEGRQVARMMQDYYRPLAAAGEARFTAALEESKRFVEEQGARPFLDVLFENERTGYVIGAWGLILRTDDGGKTWLPWLDHVDNRNSGHLNAIARIDGQTWMVGEQGLLLRFDAAAQRFVAMASPSEGSLFGITGRAGALVIYGLAGRAFASHDNGQSWTSSKLGGTSSIAAGTLLDDGRIVLVDTGSGVWVSSDAGLTFEVRRAQREMSFFGVTATGTNRLALVGIQGVQVEPLAQSAQMSPAKRLLVGAR